jgi:hypothetical protein
MANVTEIVADDAKQSDLRWQGAIQSARRDDDEDYAATMRAQRKACAKHYAVALEDIEAGNSQDALVSLEEARQLEAEQGDDCDAAHAIRAVRSELSESTAT